MKKVLLSLVIAGSAFAAQNCAMCHNGGFQSKLDKFTPAQIEKMMMEFKEGKKPGSTMPGMAKAMSAAEIKAVAQKYGKK
jgi:cytochrome c553